MEAPVEVAKPEDRYDYWAGPNPHYVDLFNRELAGFCGELTQGIEERSPDYHLVINPHGYFNKAISYIDTDYIRAAAFAQKGATVDTDKKDFSLYISGLAVLKGGASYANQLEKIPATSQYYRKAQYLIGLSNKTWSPRLEATQAFFNGAFKSKSEVLDVDTQTKAQQEFYKQLDYYETQNDFLKRDVFYARAAMAGNALAKQRVAHLYTFDDASVPAFVINVSASVRYKILQGLHVHGEYDNQQYAMHLRALRDDLNRQRVPLIGSEDKNKLLDKLECEILRHDENLQGEKEIEKFFDESAKGPKLNRLKEHVLGESKLSDYWRGFGKLIQDKWNESPIFFCLMALVAVPVGTGMAIAAFPFYAAYAIGEKARTAWIKKEGGEGRSHKEQVNVDRSIQESIPWIEKEYDWKKREKVSARYMTHSLKFFPDVKHVREAVQAQQAKARGYVRIK